jgi:hypothetical protein
MIRQPKASNAEDAESAEKRGVMGMEGYAIRSFGSRQTSPLAHDDRLRRGGFPPQHAENACRGPRRRVAFSHAKLGCGGMQGEGGRGIGTSGNQEIGTSGLSKIRTAVIESAVM